MNEGHIAHRDVEIVVNGRQATVAEEDITFEGVVLLDPTLPKSENIIYTMTYRRAEGNKSGALSAGESIKVKEGMIFNVTPATKS